MKCFATIAILACVSLVRAEPPVPQNQYLPPNQQAQQPSNNYLPPAQTYQAPTSSYLPPQRSQIPASSYQAPSSSGPISAPQSAYGAPAVTSAIFPKQQASSGYSNGNGNGYGKRDEDYGPAKYEFKYDVQDYESGNDFGHMESRDGDFTQGRYYVLLPDGRKQIVDYEADQHGYRPTIRYEQVNGGANGGHSGSYKNGGGGYDSNAQSGKFGGYQ
ncbi:pro-resilin [Teleopsis dalmanni]|uniref:pro-resilin n=1 Tax=Teleopsis dalmanni TaxID=139649 RepID=UPI000D32B412|nr:pro-resilin [Teleopsis dalmanni]